MSQFQIIRKSGGKVDGCGLTSWSVDKHVLTVICGEGEDEAEIVVPFEDVYLFLVSPELDEIVDAPEELVH